MNIVGSGFGESKGEQKMENFHFSLLLQLGLEQLQSNQQYISFDSQIKPY